jgi:putative addiction module CopG family antidote
MRKTQSLSITLPREMAQMVKDKVASGAYATESEVIREGLRALQAQDGAVEKWLRTEGVARYDAYHASPRGRPAADVFARLRRHHAARTKAARG